MSSIGSYVLALSIHSFFYVRTALLKSDVSGTQNTRLSAFWTYKDGTRFILKRNEVSIDYCPKITYSFNIFLKIIIIIKRGWQCKAGRERINTLSVRRPQPHSTNP